MTHSVCVWGCGVVVTSHEGTRAGAQNNSEVSPCLAGVGVEIGKTGMRADVGEQREN